MTHNILRYNQFNSRLKTKKDFREKYAFSGYFYEHKYKTEGYVFKEKDIRGFVRKYDKDPADVEEDRLYNFSKEFEKNINNEGVIVIMKCKHKLLENPIIKKNYFKYEVYIRIK